MLWFQTFGLSMLDLSLQSDTQRISFVNKLFSLTDWLGATALPPLVPDVVGRLARIVYRAAFDRQTEFGARCAYAIVSIVECCHAKSPVLAVATTYEGKTVTEIVQHCMKMSMHFLSCKDMMRNNLWANAYECIGMVARVRVFAPHRLVCQSCHRFKVLSLLARSLIRRWCPSMQRPLPRR